MTNAEYWTKELWSDNDQRIVLAQRFMLPLNLKGVNCHVVKILRRVCQVDNHVIHDNHDNHLSGWNQA